MSQNNAHDFAFIMIRSHDSFTRIRQGCFISTPFLTGCDYIETNGLGKRENIY